MSKSTFPLKIIKPVDHSFTVQKAGLAAIFVSARCKSKKQLKSNVDEDMRIEINGLQFREIPSERYNQLFNIPPAFNGSKLKGLKKTVIFLTVLEKGKNQIRLIPKNNAFIEEIKMQELSGNQDINLKIEEQAEDGDRRPWYTLALIDLPLSCLSAEITIEKRLLDSDDVKIIIDGKIKRNAQGGRNKFWFLTAGLLGWLIWRKKGRSKKINIDFDESLDTGIHYLEFYADKMPILHQLGFILKYVETESEKRAGDIIQKNAGIIKDAAKRFNINPVIVGAVIYQEQATNVNFIDTLTDYIGGILHFNTSIGIGQVRVKTAELLEEYYSALNFYDQDKWFIDYNLVRVERLKDPLTNIKYVAAKIHFSQDRWEKAGFSIKEKPEILGTLFNIEDIANPIKPNATPKANSFGQGVKQNYDKVENLLSL